MNPSWKSSRWCRKPPGAEDVTPFEHEVPVQYRVVVFEGGRIVEVGTYEDLVRHGGAFSELVRCAGDDQGAAGPSGRGTVAARRGA